MKKNFFVKIVVLLFAVMIAGQIVGSLTIRYFFLNAKLTELSPQLLNITDEIAFRGKTSVTRHDFIVKAYDSNNNELDIGIDKGGATPIATDAAILMGLKPYIPKILAGQTVAKITEINHLPGASIVLGKPIITEKKISGTVFLIKPVRDFQAALNGFYLVFFGASFLSGLVILLILALYLKEHRRLEQTRREYVANISHELRTPITSIKALAETLCDNMVSNEADKTRYYHIIQNESVRLERLISDMLELSRLQNRKLAFKKSHFSGADLINELTSKYMMLADDMDITLSVSESAKKLPTLYSNKDRIIQVLTILLDNGFKFCAAEGKVFIDAKQANKHIEISVINNGETISKEDLPFIFDRFYQQDKSRNSHGSGLGLAIAKEILTNLGEEISVTSNQTTLTKFTFTIKK